MKDEVVREILQEGRMYEVGGYVRDTLMETSPDPKDRDYLVSGISIDRLQTILRHHGFVDLVGRSFGVIKFTPYNQAVTPPVTYDISLPRSEVSTGTAHTDFDVRFDPGLSVEEDLIRRDFTINAMARDVADNRLIDPYGGQADMAAKLIRMVSATSFAEDPLRMLRAIQFAARFEFEIEDDTMTALRQHVDLIRTVSPERIAEELNKMFTRSRKPSIGLQLMHEIGMMALIIPELEETVGVSQPGGYHKYDVFEHTLRIVDACPPRLIVRLAALFHDITKPRHKQLTDRGASFHGHETSGAKVARQVLKRFRYSNEILKDVSLLVERHMFTTEVGPKGLRRFIRRIGQRLIPELFDLRRADVIAQGMGGTTEDVDEMEQAIREEIERKPPFGRSDLAVNGRMIMEKFSLKESPLIGDVMEYLLEMVLDNPDDNQADILLKYAGEYLENKRTSHDKN